MSEVSTLRLCLLRGMYLLITVGLGITIWPSIVAPHGTAANEGTVIEALLGALAVVSALGLRYPLRMLPILLFELLWKLIWVVAFALRMWLVTGLDAYASQTLFACLMGVVLVPIVMPWGYVFKHYLCAKGEPWRK
ncbi:MAG: hypothetical protein ACREPQ_13905 [Rhodanobacter sp.]